MAPPFDYGPIRPNGQYTNYPTLPPAEIAKGFIRPVRQKYVHSGIPGSTHADHVRRQMNRSLPPDGKGCGATTAMSLGIAETYARDPSFYGSTFCSGCQAHFPIGPQGEFTWDDGSDERVGC